MSGSDDHALVHKLIEQRRPQPFDIHCPSRSEETEPLLQLRGTGRIQAPDVYSPLIPSDSSGAHGTLRWKLKHFLLAGPLLELHAHHVRDDFARFFHNHAVADTDVLARDLVRIMQAYSRDFCAGDFDSSEFRYWGQSPGLSDLHANVFDRECSIATIPLCRQ